MKINYTMSISKSVTDSCVMKQKKTIFANDAYNALAVNKHCQNTSKIA